MAGTWTHLHPPTPPTLVSIPTCRIRQALTISRHAHCQALLQPAVLAAVAAGAVDQAVLLTGAGVGCIALLTPPEEALHRERGHGKHLALPDKPLWVEDRPASL